MTEENVETVGIHGDGTGNDGPEFVSTGAEETPSESDGEATTEVVAEPVEPVEYEPNYSYKVLDEEREFPEYLRGVVTSKEHEDQIRELLCRADGLDSVKEGRDKFKTQFEELGQTHSTLKGEHDNLIGGLGDLDHYIKHDLTSFFKTCKISPDRIIEWTGNHLRGHEDPASQQQQALHSEMVVGQRQSQTHSDSLRLQNEALMRTQHQIQSDSVMARPDVQQVATRLDTIYGVGSFKKAVDEYGKSVFNQTGQNPSPADAVQHVMDYQKPMLDQMNQVAGVAQPTVPSAQPVATIPNVGGAGSAGLSPTTQRATSIAELKEMYKRKFGDS